MAPPVESETTPSGMNRVLILLGLSIFVNYIDRANLSVAAPLVRGELGLSATQLGVLLSAFFWTYACMQPVAGWLVDRFDVKWVFAIGFFVWSVATAVTGGVHAFALFLLMRVILGVGESIAYPSYAKIFATFLAENQRGAANAIIGTGQALGPGLGMFFGGMMIAGFGWRIFFIGLGTMSLFWLIPWLRWMPRAGNTQVGAEVTIPPIAEIARQKSAWGTWIGHFCAVYALYFLLTWLPSYLEQERHFSPNRMAQIAGAVFLTMAASSLVCGYLCDAWIARGASPTLARKTFLGTGLICTGVFLTLSALASPAVSIVCLLLTGASLGANSNINAIGQTLAGSTAAGRWMGLQNCVGNLAGWVAPTLTGILVGRTGHYPWAFLIASAVVWIGVLDWVFIVGRVEPIAWENCQQGFPTLAAAEDRCNSY